jgi:hypothetical protein
MPSTIRDLPNVSGKPILVNGSRGVVVGFVEVRVSMSRVGAVAAVSVHVCFRADPRAWKWLSVGLTGSHVCRSCL